MAKSLRSVNMILRCGKYTTTVYIGSQGIVRFTVFEHAMDQPLEQTYIARQYPDGSWRIK